MNEETDICRERAEKTWKSMKTSKGLFSRAWKSVDHPPTRDDADSAGDVLFWFGDYEEPTVESCLYSEIPDWAVMWARVKDVILLPPDN